MPDEPAMHDPYDPPADPAASDAPAASVRSDTADGSRPRPTWTEQAAAARSPSSSRLDTDFAGLRAGTLRFVPTPGLIEAYLKTVPPGETRTMGRLREDLARAHACDAACPVSTAIFLRLVAEAAWEAIGAGSPPAEVAPFWRVVTPGSPVGRRLSVDPEWMRRQCALEAEAEANAGPAPISPAPAP